MPLLPRPAAADTPFSPNILASGGQLGRQSVTGPLAFTMAVDPTVGTMAQCELVSDGTHVPTFPGFTAALITPNSFGWSNVAGTVHGISFQWLTDMPAPSYTIYSVSPSVIPAIASIVCSHGLNPTLTINTNGAALSPSFVPDPSAFVVSRLPTILNDGTGLSVTSVAVSSNQIQLTLQGTVSVGDTVTLSYNPTFPGRPPYPVAAQDSSGNLLATITNASVTVT